MFKAEGYKDSLASYASSMTGDHLKDDNSKFQHGSASCYKSLSDRECLVENRFPEMEWPAPNPKPKPIKHLCDELEWPDPNYQHHLLHLLQRCRKIAQPFLLRHYRKVKAIHQTAKRYPASTVVLVDITKTRSVMMKGAEMVKRSVRGKPCQAKLRGERGSREFATRDVSVTTTSGDSMERLLMLWQLQVSGSNPGSLLRFYVEVSPSAVPASAPITNGGYRISTASGSCFAEAAAIQEALRLVHKCILKDSKLDEWAAVAELLVCSPPTKVNQVRSQAGSLRIFAPAGRRVSPRISRFPRPFIPALLHTNLASPSSALKTSMLSAAQISSRTILHEIIAETKLKCSMWVVYGGSREWTDNSSDLENILEEQNNATVEEDKSEELPSASNVARPFGKYDFQKQFMYTFCCGGGGTLAEPLVCSPPTKTNQAQYLFGSPYFRMWESFRTMPLVGGPYRESPFHPPLHFSAAPYSPQSPSLALKTSLLRPAQIYSLTHFTVGILRSLQVLLRRPCKHHPGRHTRIHVADKPRRQNRSDETTGRKLRRIHKPRHNEKGKWLTR
ncbi:hypothetical protein PR048_013724 [Dryococelus australis]|uniref:DRBM domain-containing protein n=1 Tax=Dryococelus australis TaxID=614101 RepID=A0ABQ9HT06_9NEOP|nr:hypothetical protein PR048_013724 [Dryococelus australis]